MAQPRLSFLFNGLYALLRPWLAHLAKPAAPKYRGEIAVPGLTKETRVFWQQEGIPHVFAANERDLFFAQGYLHAQERLWQMDLNRRFLSGRIAEIFGRFPVPAHELTSQFRDCDSVDVDYFMRMIGIRSCAVASVDLLGEDDRRRLEAYSAGVNSFIEQCGKRLPLEFRLLRYQPQPWQCEDTFTIGKGFALILSLALFTRMNAIAIAARLAGAPERFQDLYPCDAAGDVTTALSTSDAARNFLHAGIAADALGGFTAGHGSNAWVIGPERTEMGHAILCNDPHLRMTLPSVWYLMHLNALPAPNQSDGYEAWGATIPGCPGVHVGHNRWIAWGITAALCDDVEIYREKVHRLEPDRYQIDGEWHLMTRQRETIRIKGGGTVERTIRWTRHGPVISDFSHHTLSSDVLSLRWTAHEPSEDFRGLYQLNCARDWGEFVRALSHQSAPTLNFMYADRSGNIGFSLAGRVPLRNPVPSVLATEGWRSENEWRGFVPFADLPRLFNPPQGAIANANNPIVDDAYPFYLSRFFEPPFRVRRIYEMLAARKIHSVQHMIAAQRDEISLHARELIATLNAELAAIRSHGGDIGAAADRLLSWDGHCGTDSIAATIFHVFHHALIKTLLMPCLGEELFITYVEIFNQSISPIEKILRSRNSPWFEGRSRAELARSALVRACAEISEYLGPEQEHWQWGRLHTLTLNHPFSRVSLLRPLFSAGIFPASGDNFTVNMGFYRHSNPYEQIVGPSMRMIVETGPTFRSWFILSSGQSGHPFSKHYCDQTARWQRQEYIQLSGTEEEIRALPLLSLKPAG